MKTPFRYVYFLHEIKIIQYHPFFSVLSDKIWVW